MHSRRRRTVRPVPSSVPGDFHISAIGLQETSILYRVGRDVTSKLYAPGLHTFEQYTFELETIEQYTFELYTFEQYQFVAHNL